MKKNKIVFISGSEEIQVLTDRILRNANRRLVEAHSPYSARCVDTIAFPKRWGGYEIPLPLESMNEGSLKACKRELLKAVGSKEMDSLINHLMKDTRKFGDVEFSLALVAKCKKSRSPGVLVFWER